MPTKSTVAYAILPLPQMFRSTSSLRMTLTRPPKTPRPRTSSTQANPTSNHSQPSAEPNPHPRPVQSLHLYNMRDAPLPYNTAWDLQNDLLSIRRKSPETPDALILLEHEPVYTLGTASTLSNVLFNSDEFKPNQQHPSHSSTPLLVRTERGGEVTYHGPGQLVAYPILNLARHKKDLHWYLRALEDVVIRMLRDAYGLTAGRKDGLTGVWVDDVKVCAIGLKVSRWITMHGLALNVCADLGPFERIVPCGIDDHDVSSLHLLVDGEICMDKAREALLQSFCEVFGPYDVECIPA